jgi:ABC-2 type transport system permease protein
VRGALIAVAVVLVASLRLWRRRHSSERSSQRFSFKSVTSLVGLIAAREVRERLRGRIFKVGTLIILLVVAAAIVIPVIHHSKTAGQRVGVVGALSPIQSEAILASASSVGVRIEFVDLASVADAQRELRHGAVDLVVIDGKQLVIDQAASSGSSSTSSQLAQSVAQNLGQVDALLAVGLTSRQIGDLASSSTLKVTSLTHAKAPVSGASIIGVILLFVMLSQYNTWILIGVMEEKTSRVVEVLLATVRPVQLLAGKVIGIGTVAFGQAALIVVFAIVLGKSVGSNFLHGTAPLELVSTLVWLVLGFAFYSWVYAAAGSMAERQDQVQSLAFPLTLPILFAYIMSLTAAASQNASTLFKVLAYLPPTAPLTMPVLVGLGQVSWWGFMASAVLSVVSTVVVARLAGKIYRRAILRTGRRVRWKEVLSR